MPDAPFAYHFGLAGYTAGSAFYISPAFHGTTAVPGWVEPSSAFLFLGGSIELWASHLIRNRRAKRDTPMPGSERGRGEEAVDRFLLDRFSLTNDRGVSAADRVGLGLGFGGGLILFSALGLKALWDKEKADQKPDAKP